MREQRWAGWILSLVLVLCLAGSLLIARSIPSSLPALDAPEQPIIVEVTSTFADYGTAATLSGEYEAPAPLIASGMPGTITSIDTSTGAHLAQGDVLYRVDGVDVRGYVSETVFYRPLHPGDTGEDVAVLQTLLNDLLDRNLQDTGRYDGPTEEAVAEYSRQIGLAVESPVFQLEWFVRIPSATFQLSEMLLLVGAPAPSAGELIGAGLPELETVSLVASGDFPAGEYEFVHQGTSIPARRDGDTWIVTLDDAAQILTTAEVETVTGAAAVDGRVRITDPREVVLVPAGAVWTDDAGSTCIFRPDAAGEFGAVAVVVVGSDLTGGAQIEPGQVIAGDQVVLNPASVVQDGVRCR